MVSRQSRHVGNTWKGWRPISLSLHLSAIARVCLPRWRKQLRKSIVTSHARPLYIYMSLCIYIYMYTYTLDIRKSFLGSLSLCTGANPRYIFKTLEQGYIDIIHVYTHIEVLLLALSLVKIYYSEPVCRNQSSSSTDSEVNYSIHIHIHNLSWSAYTCTCTYSTRQKRVTL